MKLYKQTGIKASILAATVGLMAALFGLIRAHPGLGAEPAPVATPDAFDKYRDFFAPVPGARPNPPPRSEAPVHTRTRGS